MGLGETPHRLIRKRSRYSSLEKFEDAFDTALDFMQRPKRSRINDKVGKVRVNPAISGRRYFFGVV